MSGDKRRRGPKITDPTRPFLRRLKDRYLDAVKSDGGFLEEWKRQVHDQAREDPNFFKPLHSGLLDIAMEDVWRDHAKKTTDDDDDDEDDDDQRDLFQIAGINIKPELRFRDDDVPGGHRTALRKYATVAHLFSQAEITAEKARQNSEAAERQLKAANEALRRAKGRSAELLVNVRD
jgi:hypothetical protein